MNKLNKLENRHSVRTYKAISLNALAKKQLEAEIQMINTHEAGLYFSLVCGDSEPFEGFTRSYGFFRGVTNYIAAVVDDHFPDVPEKAGFYAQKLVMMAESMGLHSCFVGGTYDQKSVNVQLRAGRKILFLIAIGEAEGKDSVVSRLAIKIVHRKKMIPSDFYVSSDEWPLEKAEEKFPNLMKGLTAVACAPSSLNKRPTRIEIKSIDGEDYVTANVPESNPKNLIDLGIAKFNYQYVIEGVWDWGNGAPFYQNL